MKAELRAFFDRVGPAIDGTLRELLPLEDAVPGRLHQAMRYSTLGDGKRIRPCLCAAAYAAYKDEWRPILRVASAVELIHSYSLIHDDLPAMDDDDFRRGKPSCHKQFDESTAILAGDALLTLAFEVLARTQEFPSHRMLRVISVLAAAAGSVDGMIAGQVLDLEAENGSASAEQVEAIHRLKTGALIGVSVWIGAYLGEAPESDLAHIKVYCDRIGLTFQIIDDILDAVDGSNRDEGKATYPGLFGLKESRAVVERLMAEARQALLPLGSGRGHLLLDFCDYLETRTT